MECQPRIPEIQYVPGTIRDLPQRIIDKIDIGDPDECWEWMAAKNNKGYPIASYESKPHLATRLIYRSVNGPLGDDECILHFCDEPSCCNPRHLQKGSQIDNIADCVSKGRNARGEKHNFARLTERDVLAIRADPRNHNRTAKAYGISRETVRNIRQRRTWQHLPEET